MDEHQQKIFFACPYGHYELVYQAMSGLRAQEVETTFDNYVYFYVIIHRDDVPEFERRLAQGDFPL